MKRMKIDFDDSVFDASTSVLKFVCDSEIELT